MLVLANWKMHGSLQFIDHYMKNFLPGTESYGKVKIVFFPPACYLNYLHKKIKDTSLKIGAQNVYFGDEGAVTGELSPAMLMDVHCSYVLIGHSERRALGENEALLAKKIESAYHKGLKIVYCVGESLEERRDGKECKVVERQLSAVGALPDLKNLLIAYEPVWAIGTGKSATVSELSSMHAFIKSKLEPTTKVLYGGSVTTENVASMLSIEQVDGCLVGGASLDVQTFAAICATADKVGRGPEI